MWKTLTKNAKKAEWVLITITGDPDLANEVKSFLGLVLDWAILNEDQFLKARSILKIYDQTSALKATDRLQFYMVKKLERVIEEKTGVRIE